MTRLLTLQPESVTRLRLRNGSTHWAPNLLLALTNHLMPFDIGSPRSRTGSQSIISVWISRPTCRNGDILFPPSHHPFASSFALPTFHRVPTVGTHGHTQGRRVVFLASPSCTTQGTIRGGASYS